jgi:polysaccharide export outer membrane protein
LKLPRKQPEFQHLLPRYTSKINPWFGIFLLLSGSWLGLSSTALAFADSDAEYRIGAGDVLTIKVFGENDLSPRVKVDEKGKIPYPFLGDLQVAGLTTDELASTILNGLKGPYLIDPRVNVSIAEYRPFYIAGQVRKPGGYVYEPGLTVRKAITLAGGLTDRASTLKIFLQRDIGGEVSEPTAVSLDEAIKPGDIITVEESFF